MPEVNDETGLLESLPPTCPACGSLARPNILMFGDDGWASSRSEMQQAKLDYWLGKIERPVVIELGAGTYIPTARLFGENLSCPIIRINPLEPRVGEGRNVSLPIGALEGLNGITDALRHLGYFD